MGRAELEQEGLMRVLSLFDGISGTQQALKNLGIIPEVYFASEIDKYAIQITMKNFPDTIQLGDVTKLHDFGFGEIDLMTWGSPCQDLSIAKKNRQGLNGVRSGLFYDAVKLWKRIKPRYWLMENVASMPKESMHEISRILGVYPLTINSSLLTAQQRKRYYWTNIKGNMLDGVIPQPQDKGVLLKNILESGVVENDKSYCIDANYYKGSSLQHSIDKGTRQQVVDKNGNEKLKSNTVRSSGFGSGIEDKHNWDTIKISEATKKGYTEAKEGQFVDLAYLNSKTRRGRVGDKAKNFMTQNTCGVVQDFTIRKLTPIECERLQGFPDNYTGGGISNTQRYKCLGNSFTVPVIEHILNFMEGLCRKK